ncbi:MAG: LysR family transcriptional regulator [Desulfotomaculales bacterium]
MEWHQIVGFYHVAKTGSFTKAAALTFRTQSALSQQVKALEEEFGCSLFERIGKRGLRLTEAGETFLRFAEILLEKYEGLKEELEGLKGQQKGRLRIAAPFTTLYHLLPETLRSYVRQFPLIDLTVLDRPQRAAVALVREGEVDFGFALESAVPPDLTALRWKRVETVLLSPPEHPLTAVERVTLEQVARYPLILPPRGADYPARRRLEEHFRRLGLEYRTIIESSNVELSSLYVEMGLGIAFATVIKDLPALKRRRLKVIPLNHYFEPEHLVVVARKTAVLTAPKRAFLGLLGLPTCPV